MQTEEQSCHTEASGGGLNQETDLSILLKRTAAPAFLAPWIDRFYEREEIQRICEFQPEGEGGVPPVLPDASSFDPERSFRRGVFHRNPDGSIEIADFHTRFEIWALFEGWKDVPDEIRTLLNEWELADFTARISAEARASEPPPLYLLLHEAEALLRRIPRIYLWPCNCRAMMGGCSKPVYTCLRFENDRDIGWEISAERAVDIVRKANKAGLMQVAEPRWNEEGMFCGALCSCCSDCCYPHLAARRLGLEKKRPFSRYIARIDEEKCSACGRCVKRCPFDAAEKQKERETGKKSVRIHGEQCFGCGLCASGCPEQAVIMESASPDPEWLKIFM